MTELRDIRFAETDLEALAGAAGAVAVLAPAEGPMGPGARRLNRLTKGAVKRALDREACEELGAGEARALAWPVGRAADVALVVKLTRRPSVTEARKAGAALAKAA